MANNLKKHRNNLSIAKINSHDNCINKYLLIKDSLQRIGLSNKQAKDTSLVR